MILSSSEHQWTNGNINDILAPVEAFHLQSMSEDIIIHDPRFDFDRVPAVLELCYQAGAKIASESFIYHHIIASDNSKGDVGEAARLVPHELLSVAQRTLEAWEKLRLGVQKLLLVYPAKICGHCSEVHVGPSEHKSRLCGVFKYESWKGSHVWKRAEVDDLVPPR